MEATSVTVRIKGNLNTPRRRQYTGCFGHGIINFNYVLKRPNGDRKSEKKVFLDVLKDKLITP